MFGFLTKVLRPLMSIGQKAIPAIKSGLGSIGSKISTGYSSLKKFFTGGSGLKQGQYGKEVVKGGGVKGTADIAGGMKKAQMGIFKPPKGPPQGGVKGLPRNPDGSLSMSYPPFKGMNQPPTPKTLIQKRPPHFGKTTQTIRGIKYS
jgi:hypothetical protein